MKSLSNQQFPTTDEEVLQYLPDNEPARNMYRILREMGSSMEDAMLRVLLLWAEVMEKKNTNDLGNF